MPGRILTLTCMILSLAACSQSMCADVKEKSKAGPFSQKCRDRDGKNYPDSDTTHSDCRFVDIDTKQQD